MAADNLARVLSRLSDSQPFGISTKRRTCWYSISADKRRTSIFSISRAVMTSPRRGAGTLKAIA